MKQKEMMKKLNESAKLYKENLQNKNILVMYEKNRKIEYIEILFLARNFMHYVVYINKDIEKIRENVKLLSKLKVEIIKSKKE